MPSIRNNFLYKTLLTISSYIIGFITFPYVSRVLGVDGIGAVNFADNSVGYFILFASMGIAILGTREIAATKDDQARRNRVFSNLLGLNIIFTTITIIVYIGLITLVPRFAQNAELFYIGAAKIIATVFLVEWFFTGLEEFRYITIRSIVIKLLYVVAVFTLINDKSDYKLYFTLSVATVIINALVNIIYARKFVRINRQALFSMRYLKEYVTLGLYSIMTSMYITFNVMFLGLSTDNTQVGYYTTAFKLYIIMLGIFSAFTSVTMPRISAMLANGQHKDFTQIVAKSFDGIIKFILPMIICGVILAPQIILVISGEGFEGAVLPMRIIFPAALGACRAGSHPAQARQGAADSIHYRCLGEPSYQHTARSAPAVCRLGNSHTCGREHRHTDIHYLYTAQEGNQAAICLHRQKCPARHTSRYGLPCLQLHHRKSVYLCGSCRSYRWRSMGCIQF